MSDSPLPQTVIVELTNRCNLNCPLCSTAMAMKRPPGFMSDTLFQKIAEEAAGWDPPPEFAFTMCGEPLLHPRVCEYIAFATRRQIRCSISTNVTALTNALGNGLIQAGTDRILLCVDGYSARSHEAYRRGSCFDRIKAQCEGFLACRKQAGAALPQVVIQTLITSFNEGELENIERWAMDIGADALYLKTLSIGSHLTSEQQDRFAFLLPRADCHRRGTIRQECGCRRPETQTIVYWNGNVGLCCIDFNDDHAIGSIVAESLADVLGSQRVRSIREQAGACALPLCRRCRSSGGLPGIMIDFKP